VVVEKNLLATIVRHFWDGIKFLKKSSLAFSHAGRWGFYFWTFVENLLQFVIFDFARLRLTRQRLPS
jgi:hypothetical protein